MKLRRAHARSAVLISLLVACGGESLTLPTEGEPAGITILQGNDQTGRVGEPLAEPIVARVTDARGRAVIGAPVAVALTSGEATVSPDGARTDTDGVVTFELVLGSRVGTLAGRVGVTSGDGEMLVETALRLTAVSADAAGITLASGDAQTGTVGTALAAPLVVQVADVFGNPIPGVPIVWTTEGGGSVSADVVETDADGRASVQRTLGPASGVQRTRASADGLAGSPVTFVHTATAGSAARLEPVSGNGQSAVVGTPLPDELVVRLLDPEGNPVTGTAVAWVVGEGAGSVAPTTIPTDAEGRAATRWTLGTAAGPQTVTAVVSGVGVVTFTATAVAGTPPGMRIVQQPAGSARRGVALSPQPVVQLVDPSGADLRQAGVPVTVAVATGGGRARGTVTRTTDANGVAAFTDLALEGPAGSYTLAFGAPGFTGAISSPIQLARAITTTVIEADTPDPSAPGAVVRVTFSVASDGGRPSGNVVVRAEGGASCQAAVTAGACSLALTQPGTQQITASYQGDAEFEPSSDTDTHTVEVPATPTLVLVTQPSSTAAVGVPFASQPVVQLQDGRGNPVATAGVAITAGIASGSGNLLGQITRSTDAAGRATFEGLGITGGTGPHVLRFTADGYAAAASGVIEVQPTTTSLRITSDAPDPSEPGQAVEVRYSLTAASGIPPGDVTVTAGAAACTGTAATGVCSLVLAQPGSYTITARYAGAPGFAPAEATEPHTVSAPTPQGPSASTSTVTVEPGSVAVGAAATVRVTVRDAGGTALGGVDVTLAVSGTGNSVSPGTSRTDGNGIAEFTVRSTVVESKTITATAGGVTLDQRPTLVVTPAASTTRIESDTPDPSDVGTPFTVRVTVRGEGGTPGGAVTVSAGGQTCSAVLSGGNGACDLVPSAAGSITITAEYPGDAAFAGSSATEPHEVREPAARILVIRTQPSDEASPGETLDRQPEVQLALEGGGEVRQAGVVVRVALAGGPGTLAGTTSAETGDDGRARFQDLGISGPEGTYALVFSADGFTSVTSSSIELRRTESRTRLVDDEPDPSEPGESVQVRFEVTGGSGGATPTGSVTVSADGGASCSGALDGNGEGSCTLVLSQEGEVTLRAVYGGDSRYAGSEDDEAHRVEAENQSPSAQADEFSLLEDTSPVFEVPDPGVLANDADPDGDPLSASLVTGAGVGAVSLSPGGGFRYTPPADFSGETGFSYQARDAGAGSAPVSVRIVVQPVNDAPAFVPGGDLTVPAAAGPQSVAWATGISPGPAESGQSLRFEVSVTSGSELFETLPAVSAAGELTFDPGAAGAAEVLVALVDDGGTANGGVDRAGPVTLRLTFAP